MTNHKSCKVSYEDAVNYHSDKPRHTGLSVIALCSLPPLFFNLGTPHGLLCWGICGLFVVPVVMSACGPTSMPAKIAQAVTGFAFINAFISMWIPQWVLFLVYSGIVIATYAFPSGGHHD